MTEEPNEPTSPDAVQERYGEPLTVAVECERSTLHEHHQRFIAHSPYLCIASVGPEGFPTLSPKGDAPGFVHVRDERTLVIPDRPGNNKIETVTNILDRPKVGLIFFVPGIKETLRVEGTARLVFDEATLATLAARGKQPRAAMVVEVSRAYLHCGKSVARSGLWDPQRHIEPGVLPSFGQVVRDLSQMDESAEEIQASLDRAYKDRLY